MFFILLNKDKKNQICLDHITEHIDCVTSPKHMNSYLNSNFKAFLSINNHIYK